MTSKAIFLTGNELAATGLSGANAHIRNDSTSVVYAAKMPGISDSYAAIERACMVQLGG